MSLEVVDYSEEYYLRVKRADAVPPKRGGKFVVVVEEGGREYVVFSPTALTLYHANIVERFVESRGAVGQYNPKRDEYWVDTPGWAVEGGGRWRLDAEAGVLEVFGVSIAYGGVDCVELARRLTACEAFSGVEVVAP